MKKNIIFLMVLFCFFCSLNAQNRTINLNSNYFIQNNGQWDKKVKYLTKMNNANIWINDDGITYDFFKVEYPQGIDKRKRVDITTEAYKTDRQVVNMKFVGSDKYASFTGLEKLATYHNYFIGNDKTKWATNVPLYKEIEVKEIYSGIDQRFYYDDNYVRYDIIIKPGADPNKISMEFAGANAISIDNNELTISTMLGDVKNNKLYVYQEVSGKREEIECKFIKDENGNIGFDVGKYNKSAELIIDPIIYSTFLGGSGDEVPVSIKVDKDGNCYITGSTYSSDFPIMNQYQNYLDNYVHCFITKLSPDGSSLIFSTYFGGKAISAGYDLVLDEQNNIYICGGAATPTNDFPLYNPLPPPHGPSDRSATLSAFVSIFNSEGNRLLYSTTIGSDNDRAAGITINKNNDIYICGRSRTPGLRTIGLDFNEIYPSLGPMSFVAKLEKNGDSYRLGYYNYTPFWDLIKVLVDNDGNAYTAGAMMEQNTTEDILIYYSKNFQYNNPLPMAAGHKIGIYKINDVTGPVFTRHIGSAMPDNGESSIESLALGNNNEICIVGSTLIETHPITEDALRKTHNGYIDGYISKFSSDGKTILYSTFFGEESSGYDNRIRSISLDRFGRTVITGVINPLTPINAEFFITRFKLGDTAISYSTSIMKDDLIDNYRGNFGSYSPTYIEGDYIYVCTYTNLDNFITTPDVYQNKKNGEWDAVILKLDVTSYFDIKGRILQDDIALEGLTVTLSGDGSASTTTDNNGNYAFQKMKEDYYTLSFKIGNNTYEHSFVLLDEDKTLDFNNEFIGIKEPEEPVYVVTEFRWEPTSKLPADITTSRAAGTVETIEVASNGDIWVGTFTSDLYGTIYLSTDNGDTWIQKTNGLSKGGVRLISINPINGYIFVLLEDAIINGIAFKSLFRSIDNGESWTKILDKQISDIMYITPFGELYISSSLLADFIGEHGVYCSSDNGDTWTKKSNGLPNNCYVNSFVMGLDGTLYASVFYNIYNGRVAGLLYCLTNGEDEWILLPRVYVYNYDILDMTIAIDGSIFVAAFVAGIFRSTDKGLTWNRTPKSGGIFGGLNNIICDPKTGHIFVNCNIFDATYRSTNFGNNWYPVHDGIIGGNRSNGSTLAVNPSTGMMFLGTKDGTVYRAMNRTISIKEPINVTDNSITFLFQNYPNPFNPSTVIKYQLSDASQVSLRVYDVMGREVANLVNSYQNKGSYDITFNAQGLASGIYFYKLNTNNKQLVNKMLLMK